MSDKVQSPIFESKVKPNSARFERNVHTMAELVTRVRNDVRSACHELDTAQIASSDAHPRQLAAA